MNKKKVVFHIFQALTMVALGAAVAAFVQNAWSLLFNVLCLTTLLLALGVFLNRPKRSSPAKTTRSKSKRPERGPARILRFPSETTEKEKESADEK